MDFAERCFRSSRAWGDPVLTEMRAIMMIASGLVLTAAAWRAIDDRLDAHASNVRRACTIPSRPGRVWCNSVAIRQYRRLRSLQAQVRECARAADQVN